MRYHWAVFFKNTAGLRFLKLGEQFVHQLANGDVVGGALTAPSTRLASPRYSLVLGARGHLAQKLITKKLDCNGKGLVGVFPSSSLATCHPVPWHNWIIYSSVAALEQAHPNPTKSTNTLTVQAMPTGEAGAADWPGGDLGLLSSDSVA